MIRYKLTTTAGLILSSLSICCFAAAGFATRDLNPILQSIYIPGFNFHGSSTWQLRHSLYITNTLQRKSSASESLLIDVENYRYELALGHRSNDWVMQATLPLIFNRGGELDGLIDDWHKFFGLPEGNRSGFSSNQIEIEYIRDGVTEYLQTSHSSGLGDIAIAIGYQPTASDTGYFIGLELPTGAESDYSGNEALDLALWLTHTQAINPQTNWYGLLGITIPGDGGALNKLLVEQIWIAQIGANYKFDADISAIVQFDMHSKTLENTALDAFGNSVQVQVGLRFDGLIEDHSFELFFTEDIFVGSAPDFSIGLNLIRVY